MKLGTLNYNQNSEEGEVKFEPSVDLTQPDVVMLDILGGWIAALTIAYNDLIQITFPHEENN